MTGYKNKPINFVLVHGSFHGGWVWRDVRKILEGKGHRVFSPSLTGCGDRKHLASPDVGLQTHITDITNIIEFEELEDVVLVGHSFAGLVITGVADQMKSKIRKLVYLDCLVTSGDKLTAIPRDENGDLPDWFQARATDFKDGYMMSHWDDYGIDMLLPADSLHAPRVKRLVTDQPMRSWTDVVELKNGGWLDVSRAYILCAGQKVEPTTEWMFGPAKGKSWDFTELDIPRDGMVTHPALVADTFLKLALDAEPPQ